MSDTEKTVAQEDAKASRRARMDLMKDWQVSADGRSVTRTFATQSYREAARFASRVVAYSGKHGVSVDLHTNGTNIVVGMPHSSTPSMMLDRKQRGIAQRLERLLSRDGQAKEEEGKQEGAE